MRLDCRINLPSTHLHLPAVVLLAVATLFVTGCRVMDSSSSQEVDSLLSSTPAEPISSEEQSGDTAPMLPAPGAGVLGGRLVDSFTGLGVADAGVTLLGLNRRTISGPDGSFRFDAVADGPVSLVLGPADGYVPRSLHVRVPTEGLDFGIAPLIPVSPPTLIVPEYGGTVAACGATRLTLSEGAVAEPEAVSLTCVDRVDDFPAEAPAGRLPLAVVHASPDDLVVSSGAELVVELPSQPRYAQGVELELLRLDLERLIWTPTALLTVEPGGSTAKGRIDAFGSYMAVAPAYGTFAVAEGEDPAITRFNLSDAPDGPPVGVFPIGTRLVYASFDYIRMRNTLVSLRTVDISGDLLYEVARPYTQEGTDNVPMAAPNGPWPEGRYVTTVYIGDPPAAQSSIGWRVAGADTPTPAPATLPPVAPPVIWPAPPAAPRPPTVAACQPYTWWYAYTVRPGDTLYGLASATGTDVPGLMQANCLTTTRIVAGQVIYLPQPPIKPPPTYPTRPHRPTATEWAPLTTPTTWYTPPVPTATPTIPAPAIPIPTQVLPSVPPPTLPVPTQGAPATAVPPTLVPPATQVPTAALPPAPPPTEALPPPPEPTAQPTLEPQPTTDQPPPPQPTFVPPTGEWPP